MPTKSLQIRCSRVLDLVRVTKDGRESNCVAGKSGDGKRIQVSNNRSWSRWVVNAKNLLAALDESSVAVAVQSAGIADCPGPSAQPRVGTLTCEQHEELRVWAATKVSREHFS